MPEFHVCGVAGKFVPEIIDAMNGSGPKPEAVTIGDLRLFFGKSAYRPGLKRHESKHSDQCARFAPAWLKWAPYKVRVWAGTPKFLRVYKEFHDTYGYHDNPLEVEARLVE